MTEDQLYMPIRNERILLVLKEMYNNKNSCDYVNQNVAFDLEKYDPYLDKIRALFVPSLEYKVYSLLKEFVYSTDSLWAKRFPCFKKFVNAMATWKGPLNKFAEYNIDTMEEMIKNTVKYVVKDNLVTCFLNSIILHHRLNKICRELDALGIEDNILRNLNIWNFVNEKNYLDCTCFAYETHSVDCNTNSNVAEEAARCKKAVKPLAANEVYHDGSTEHMRPTMSEYRAMEHQQLLDSNKNFLQQKEDNSNANNSTCSVTGLQNDCTDCTDKAYKSFNEKSCDTISKKIWSIPKLKTIVHKMYLKDCCCLTLSRSVVTYLSLPCKSSNLIKQIFKVDPSLSESCLIVIKRKFEASMYNVCSCLNDILRKINVEFVKALHLDCEIRPGYICFKLKIDKAGNINKCLFVARVPICQNVHKHAVQQHFAVSSSKMSTKVEELKCSKQCKDNHSNFNDTLVHIDEESKNLSDSNLSSRSDRSLVKDMATDMSQGKTEYNDEEKSTCITEEVFYCNKSCENMVKGICNITSCNDNLNEGNKEYCKIFDSIEIDYNNDPEKYQNDILVSCNAIINNDKPLQLENHANCMCLPSFNKMSNGIENVFSDKESDNFSQITDVNKHDWICLPDKESNLENENCNINTCSITSFVQNPEHDKQLVELNYNRFSDNNIKAIDRQLDSEDDNSLNSAKVEIGCDSSCSCRLNDFIGITVIDNISEKNIVCTFEESRNDLDAVKTRNTNYSKRGTSSKNNSLTVSVQTPRLKVSLKNDDVDIRCPRTTLCLASDNDKSISTIMKTRDEYNETTDSFVRALIIPKKGNWIFRDIDMEVFNMRDRMQGFIKSSERSLVSKGLGSNKDLRSFSISTEEYLHAENHSVCMTSNTSQYCRSFATTSEFRTSDRRDEIQKSYKSNKLSKLRRRGRANSSNDIRSVTSFTTIKYRNTPCSRNNDYVKDTQPQMIFVMTKLRNSVDRSVGRIKRMIRAKLKRMLFNNKAKTMSTTKTLCKNKESSEDTMRRKTSRNCIRQGYNITSRSISDCCRRDYTISSCESSNVILSIPRNQGRVTDEGGMNFHDYRLVGESETLSSFRSIKAFPWSYDLLTSTPENSKEGKFSKNSRPRYNKKRTTEDKRDIIKCNKNSCQCNSRNFGTNITISSQSAKVSLIENDSEYFERRKCKQRKETRDNKHVCKQKFSQDRQRSEEVQHKCRRGGKKKKYQEVPAKYTSNTSDKSSETSSSYTWARETKNVHKQFQSVSEPKKVKKKFALLGKNRQLFEKDLHKRRAFEMLIDTCNDYVDDLDLDFKLKLLHYVELCKSVKRLLIRTLQPDDINKINMASMHASDL